MDEKSWRNNSKLRLLLLCLAVAFGYARAPAQVVPLFDGNTFQGWEGDTVQTWRIENGTIVAGALDKAAPRNDFLATTKTYENFELRVKYR